MTGVAGLPPVVRLRQRADFAALRQAAGKARGTWFLCRYRLNAEGHARLGMAVSRKVSPRAVERNRIKRQIRESFRHHRAMLPSVDLFVVPHRSAAGQASALLREDLDRLWTRVHALK